jgi:hypothetical protein
MINKTPSQQAKAAGLKSLRELSDISDVSTRTLENWHKERPHRFAVMLAGAVEVKAKGTENAAD